MKFIQTFFYAIFLTSAFLVAANAATITVTNTNDSGAGSLRQAIASATAGDTIDFNLAGCPCTITLTSAQLLINKRLNIAGPGADQLSVSGSNARRVFFIRTAASTVTISGLTITNGLVSDFGGGVGLETGTFVTISNSVISNNSVTGGAGTGYGGGIFADAGSSVSILNSTISNNSAASAGGGIGTLPGASFAAEITLSNSSVSNNSAGTGGGGVFLFTSNSLTAYNTNFNNNTSANGVGGAIRSLGNLILRGGSVSSNSITSGVGDGGGIFSSGSLSLTGVTVSGNSTANGEGGGIFNSGTATIATSNISNNTSQIGGGGIASTNILTMSNTIVADNNTNGNGGGIATSSTANISASTISGNDSSFGNGGGINNSSALTITNSTISTNPIGSGLGGGINNESDGTVNMTNCTVAFNSTQFRGGGIYSSSTGTSSFSVRSSIIAKNTAQSLAPDVGGIFFSVGFNLIGNDTINVGFTNGTKGDIVGGGPTAIDPLLGTLFDNGGFTKTHALLNGSPAIDSGRSGIGITTDQRGNQRFVDINTIVDPPGGNSSDIGAFEYMATTAALVTITGKISAPDGNGIDKVKVFLRMPNGETKTVLSNGFGYFQFEDLEVGQTYIVTASSKRHSFEPQIVTIFDEITDLNLVAVKQE